MSSLVMRMIAHDRERRNASRRASRLRSASLPCVAPSTSTTRRAEILAKSAMYAPMGCCRRNRTPPMPWRSFDHRIVSAPVRWRRSFRARSSVFGATRATQHPVRATHGRHYVANVRRAWQSCNRLCLGEAATFLPRACVGEVPRRGGGGSLRALPPPPRSLSSGRPPGRTRGRSPSPAFGGGGK